MESNYDVKRIVLTEWKLAEMEKIKKKDKIIGIICRILLALQLVMMYVQITLYDWAVYVILGLGIIVIILCGIKVKLSDKITDIIAGVQNEEE